MHETERKALADLKMASPAPVQTAALQRPHPDPDHLLVLRAPSGTGKTIAYLLALARRLDATRRATQALVVLPTRELVLQSHAVATALFAHRNPALQLATVLPDSPRNVVVAAHLVFATPGTLAAKLKYKELLLAGLDTLVLDEADQLLLQFLPDLLGAVQKARAAGAKPRALAMSATWPALAEQRARALFAPDRIQLVAVERSLSTASSSSSSAFAERMTQYVMRAKDAADKRLQVRKMLETVSVGGSTICFFQRGADAEQLAKELVADGFSVASLFAGNMTPVARDTVMNNFRSRKCTVLLATNVLARGIDIRHVTFVINADLPMVAESKASKLDEDTYLHRVGRAARFGDAGLAFTLVASAEELALLRAVEAKHGAPIAELPRPLEQPDAFEAAVKRCVEGT